MSWTTSWWVAAGIAAYLMIGGTIARVFYLSDVTDCGHCSKDDPCEKHCDSFLAAVTFLWIVAVVVGCPFWLCCEAGDGVWWLIGLPERRAKQRAEREKQRKIEIQAIEAATRDTKAHYLEAVGLLRDVGIEIPDEVVQEMTKEIAA